jgi:two-component system cell cycle sensor histidine kinase/response regulator CckA
VVTILQSSLLFPEISPNTPVFQSVWPYSPPLRLALALSALSGGGVHTSSPAHLQTARQKAQRVARETILIVEDDKIIAMELRARLQRWGFTVPATAATGEEAIAATLKHQPHLVLMDIWLQGPMDGIAAAERIHRSVDTPIIYVTANADESTLERAKRTEPYGYVLKPFEEVELRTTIEIALYKHATESKIKESEQWLSTTLTSIGDAVIATNERGMVTFINPVALELMRVTRDDVLGKDLGEIFHIVDVSTRARAANPAGAALANGEIHRPSNQTLLLASDGTEIPIYYNVAPIRGAKGNHQGVVLVFRDVTERIRAEQMQSALYRISEAATSARDLQTLFTSVHQIVAGLLPARNFYLALCDPARATISFPYFVDEYDAALGPQILAPRPFGRGITEFLIQNEGTLLLSGDTLHQLAAEKEIAIIGTVPYFWLGTPLRTADGQTIGAVAVQSYTEGIGYSVRDKDVLEFVSTQIAMAIERKRAEQTLRESEERFRTIFARSAIGIGISDIRSRRITESNAALQAMLGYSAAELREKTTLALLHPEDVTAEVENERKLLEGHTDHFVAEKRYIRKDGNIVWGRTTVSLVKDPAGAPLFGIALMEDITQKNDAEEKIREQAALLDHAQDAICVRDLESKITYWNKGAERLYGWTSREVLGQNEFDLLMKEVSPDVGRAQKEVLENGEWVGELTQRTKAADDVIVQSHWTLVRNGTGDPASVLVINTNMTDRKKLEAQFLRAQRLESIGTLAGGIAHDLNNVLSPIMLAAHLLRSRTTDPTMRKWIDTIEASTQRGAGILSQVLTFARGATGKRMLVQPKHLLKEMGKIATETFPRSIDTNVDVPRDLWTITGDPTQLHQVLMNLCVNARDAMPAGGTLTIKGENVILDDDDARQIIEAVPGPYVMLTVSDTGAGIPKQFMEKIFEPFFTTKEPGRGTGLGLSTVHAIVKSHKGFIRLASDQGKGTTFQIYLPAQNAGEATDAVEETDHTLTGSNELILVIDDERMILNVTEEMLGTSGYRALTTANGKEGVALYARHANEIQAVLVDMMMPQMDGLAVIQALRRMNPGVKILAMSGLPRQRGNDPGRASAQNFLAKPFSAATLLRALRDILGKNGSASAPAGKMEAA